MKPSWNGEADECYLYRDKSDAPDEWWIAECERTVARDVTTAQRQLPRE